MIAIVSSSARECSAFAAVCDSRRWPNICCGSVRAFRKVMRDVEVKVVLTRQKLDDGYSDDVLGALKTSPTAEAKVIVLLAAGGASSQQARQVALGADCVLHDPVRTDVLVEYLARYRAASGTMRASRERTGTPLRFAGATIHPLDRTLRRADKAVVLTARELDLVRLLVEARDRVVTYETLYSEILGRRFSGDTANMRVLLGRLDAALRKVGIPLRQYLEVIPKSGYRYRESRPNRVRLARPPAPLETEAA